MPSVLKPTAIISSLFWSFFVCGRKDYDGHPRHRGDYPFSMDGNFNPFGRSGRGPCSFDTFYPASSVVGEKKGAWSFRGTSAAAQTSLAGARSSGKAGVFGKGGISQILHLSFRNIPPVSGGTLRVP